MVLIEVTSLMLNADWHKLTDIEQDNSDERDFEEPEKCLINPAYITRVEPALDRPGYIYVYIAEAQYAIKSTLSEFNKAIKSLDIQRFIFN